MGRTIVKKRRKLANGRACQRFDRRQMLAMAILTMRVSIRQKAGVMACEGRVHIQRWSEKFSVFEKYSQFSKTTRRLASSRLFALARPRADGGD